MSPEPPRFVGLRSDQDRDKIWLDRETVIEILTELDPSIHSELIAKLTAPLEEEGCG